VITPYIKASKEMDLGGKKAGVYGSFGLGYYGVSTDGGNLKHNGVVGR